MPRVKFTLTKLQEDVSENRAETNYSASEIISTDKIKTKLFILQTHVGQANRKPKAKQKEFQIKTLGRRLMAHSKIFGKLLLSP